MFKAIVLSPVGVVVFMSRSAKQALAMARAQAEVTFGEVIVDSSGKLVYRRCNDRRFAGLMKRSGAPVHYARRHRAHVQ